MQNFTPINLGIRSNPLRRGKNKSAQLINCWAQENGDEAVTPWSIYPDCGFTYFGSLIEADAGIRGGITVGEFLYVVAGRNFYRISSSGEALLIGGVPTDGPVYMDYNRKVPSQIGIVSAGYYFVFDVGGSRLTRIEDPDLQPPNSFAFLNGYGLLPSEKRFSITGLDDFTTIGALDFSSADAYPDDIVRVLALEGEAVFLGADSIEWFQDTGGDFPFTRSHATQIGCLAGGSAARVDTDGLKTIVFVATDHTVRKIAGYETQVISTPEIAQRIKDYVRGGGDLAQMQATAWAWAGQFRYALSCPNWTRVYDAASNRWTNKQSFGLDRWRISNVFAFGTKLIAGDYATGQLYELRDDAFAEGDDPLLVEVITPPVHAYPYPLIFDALALKILQAQGDGDATVLVQWSRDGGETYHAYEEARIGNIGETTKRIMIRQLGMSGPEGMVFKFTIAADVFTRFDGASVAFTKTAA